MPDYAPPILTWLQMPGLLPGLIIHDRLMCLSLSVVQRTNTFHRSTLRIKRILLWLFLALGARLVPPIHECIFHEAPRLHANPVGKLMRILVRSFFKNAWE